MDTVITINKSEVTKLDLSGEDPLNNELDIIQRINKLKKAVKLNTASTRIISLIVMDKDRGLFKIKAKVNMVSNDNVALRGGILIPISSIKEVILL
ncbi:MAG: hypothetical protein JKY09_04410 [Crocinitomicaceae bacterium]|nr:hypothetical protein [Crocinitomicaceae bacterium]